VEREKGITRIKKRCKDPVLEKNIAGRGETRVSGGRKACPADSKGTEKADKGRKNCEDAKMGRFHRGLHKGRTIRAVSL